MHIHVLVKEIQFKSMKGKAINELRFSIENLVFLSYGITGNSLHGFYQYHPDYLVECTVCNEVKQH